MNPKEGVPAEPLPCPFCGGTRIEFDNTDERARLRCYGCGTEGGLFFFSEYECEHGVSEVTEAKAIKAWNTRAEAALPNPPHEREAFEDFCSAQGYRTRRADRGYSTEYTQRAWIAWQARAALPSSPPREPALTELRSRLQDIVDWKLPPTDDKWQDGSPVSYGAKWGSNGERDYIREVARQALEYAAMLAVSPKERP